VHVAVLVDAARVAGGVVPKELREIRLVIALVGIPRRLRYGSKQTGRRCRK
jgi:hypothetical protein